VVTVVGPRAAVDAVWRTMPTVPCLKKNGSDLDLVAQRSPKVILVLIYVQFFNQGYAIPVLEEARSTSTLKGFSLNSSTAILITGGNKNIVILLG